MFPRLRVLLLLLASAGIASAAPAPLSAKELASVEKIDSVSVPTPGELMAALNKVALMIVESHAKSCVVTAFKEDRVDQSIDELMNVLKQFTK